MIKDNTFLDSTVRQKAEEMLGNFEDKHVKRMLNLTQSKVRIENAIHNMEDKLIVLKFAVTQPIINKYLDRNLPKNTGTQEIINEYESLLKQVEKEIETQ